MIAATSGINGWRHEFNAEGAENAEDAGRAPAGGRRPRFARRDPDPPSERPIDMFSWVSLRASACSALYVKRQIV